MPKYAGPCGQALCSCEPAPPPANFSTPTHPACCEESTEASAPARTMLSAGPVLRASPPALAYQLVFTGLDVPDTLRVHAPETERVAPGFADAATPCALVHSGVPTPPPRT
ncbi:MAG: hypothetical protein KIS92_23065 [Planctomycetota bacterium]|nr:hypothetical protein [Planctomycetota bacterium]